MLLELARGRRLDEHFGAHEQGLGIARQGLYFLLEINQSLADRRVLALFLAALAPENLIKPDETHVQVQRRGDPAQLGLVRRDPGLQKMDLVLLELVLNRLRVSHIARPP